MQIKEETEGAKDYHIGSCKEEIVPDNYKEDEAKPEGDSRKNTEEIFEAIKNADENEMEFKVLSEADATDNISEQRLLDEKAVEEPDENLLADEPNDRSFHQKEQKKIVEQVTTKLKAHEFDHLTKKTSEDPREEVNSSILVFQEDEDNRTGGNDINNVMTKDAELLGEYMTSDPVPTKPIHKTTENCEANNENANTIMMEQQEDYESKRGSLPLPELSQGQESEKQDKNDEICSSDKVQAKEEEKVTISATKSEVEADKVDTLSRLTEDENKKTHLEVEKLDFSSHTKDTSEISQNDGAQDIPKCNEISTTTNEFSEVGYPNESTEFITSTVSKDVELIEQASKAKTVIAESGTDSDAVPETAGVECGQEENASDNFEGMTESSTSMVSTQISTSEIMQEHVTGTSLVAEDLENQDQLTKLHESHLLSHVKDSEVGMDRKQGPVNLQSGSDKTDDVQELNEGCVRVSNKGNLLEANSNENIEAEVSSGGKEADTIQRGLVSNTVEQEIQEQQLGKTVEAVLEEKGMNSEEKKIKDDNCNDLKENSSSVATDKVSPSDILQGSTGNAAQGDKNQETQQQHGSLPILPQIKFSDMEIAQKDIPLHFARLGEDDLKEFEAAPLPAPDKRIVLAEDHTNKANTDSPIGSNIPVLQQGDSSESSLTEGEKQEPSKREKEEEKCGHEETTKPRKTSESTEIDKPSRSDLLQVSVKETSQIADHFTNKKEPTIQREELQAEKSDEAAHEKAKTGEEKDDEEEFSERKSSDMSSEAPVMVDAWDTDVKVAHKKSHNILSGVGSKVKHSIAKVKKAITGKSSHPKSHSPKYGEKS